MRKIKMEKIAEIIRLHFKLDFSVRQTSSALNVSRSSVKNFKLEFLLNNDKKSSNFFINIKIGKFKFSLYKN